MSFRPLVTLVTIRKRIVLAKEKILLLFSELRMSNERENNF